MARVPGAAAAAAHPPIESGILERAAGVVFRPRATMAGVVAGPPRWAGILALSSGAAVLASTLFYATEVGRQALVDHWERLAFAFGQDLDDARYAQLVELGEYSAVYGAASGLATVAGVSAAATLAAYIFLGGGNRSPKFRQVLAVTAHASVILALRPLIGAPVGYLRETAAGATSLGTWFQLFAQGSPASRFLDLMDVIVLWWAVVAGIGLARLYGKPARQPVLALVGVYAGLALFVAGLVAMMGSA